MGIQPPEMTDFKPYLIKATYEWIIDNGMTPQLIICTAFDGVDVPDDYRGDTDKHKILLNISPTATLGFLIDLKTESISFHARFSGAPHFVRIPMEAIESIHARENGQGAMFSLDTEKRKERTASVKKPGLRLVK